MNADKGTLFNSGFCYDLSATTNELRPRYEYDVTCQGTVPAALIAFLDSTDFESAFPTVAI